MQNAHDDITVGHITLPYSEFHHGWITPNNNVTTNPATAQLIAERENNQLASIHKLPVGTHKMPLGIVVIKI